MKLFLTAIAMMMPLVAADKTTAKPEVPVRAAASPKAMEIPQGAVETQAGTYSYKDAAGKKWIYRKTPFGIARMEDKGQGLTALATPAAAPAVTPKTSEEGKVKAVAEGDTVHFERQGPFGVYRWDRQKSELNDAEREWLAGANSNSRASARQE